MSGKEPTDKAFTRKSDKKVTLQDVANALGVSKATVSLCLNGSSLVADNTRTLVLKKIQEFDYVYNRGAASLSTGESKTIGLAVHALTNPYFTQVCSSIEAVLSQNGRMSFLCNTEENLDRQALFLQKLSEHNADGLILCPALGTKAQDLDVLRKNKLPIVLISRGIESSGLDYVGNDDELALSLATEHIIQCGHRRIAMLGGSKQTSVGKSRRLGFVKTMQNCRLEVISELLIDCAADATGGRDAAKVLMLSKNPPTAIVCFNDLVALGAMSALHELGLQPGKDVALIGCDGIEEGGRAYVQLSTVNVQKAAIGRVAAEILLERLSDPGMRVKKVLQKPELLVRQTCGFKS